MNTVFARFDLRTRYPLAALLAPLLLLAASGCSGGSQGSGDKELPVAGGDSGRSGASPGSSASSGTTGAGGAVSGPANIAPRPEKGNDTTPDDDGEQASTDPAPADNGHSTNPDGGANDSHDSDTTPKREPLFEGWPEPKLVLFITGRQNGYIEPCGCTGLANQKGGLARRHTFYQQLVKRGWNVVPLDVGSQVRRFGRQPEIKFQFTAAGLASMKYQGVTLGPDDLRLSGLELYSLFVNLNRDARNPFVGSNVTVLDPQVMPTYRVLTVGEKRVGITSVLGDEEQRRVNNGDVTMLAAEEGLRKAWDRLKEEKCDFNVLLVHADLDATKRLAQAFPNFDVVVTAGGADEPAFRPEKIPDSKALLVQVGAKGMYVGVLGVFDDAKEPYRFQRVPLDARFEDSREMLDLLAAYQRQLEQAGLERLGLKPIPHPSGREFVGSEKCGECHTTAYGIWKKTPHAHATTSIAEPTERSEIPRHYDPECLSCHVTGWNPQKYFPYASGYLSLDKTPLMVGNGCENCHGPGSAHVAAEEGEAEATDEEIAALQAEMRLPFDQAEHHCMECHDLDNSPDFHAAGAFEKYWKQIEHKGKY